MPIFVGRVQLEGEEFPGTHAAIVSEEHWQAVARQRAQRHRQRPKAKGRGRPAKGSHLFVGGLLKCGRCGESIVPRGDRYVCYGRLTQGPDFCPQPRIPRALVDEAVFRYFEDVALDVDATRRELETALEHKTAEVRELRQAAERERREAEARLARVKRDYQDGRLEADDWREQRAELSTELEAASAGADQLRAREEAIATHGRLRDVEEETLRRLAELRANIADGVTGAPGLDAVRAALMRLFERFELRPVPPLLGDARLAALQAENRKQLYAMLEDDGLRPLEAGEYEIVPVPQAELFRASEEAVVPWLGADPAEADRALAARPFIPREPLYLAENKTPRAACRSGPGPAGAGSGPPGA